jgi:hypothetical protein
VQRRQASNLIDSIKKHDLRKKFRRRVSLCGAVALAFLVCASSEKPAVRPFLFDRGQNLIPENSPRTSSGGVSPAATV